MFKYLISTCRILWKNKCKILITQLDTSYSVNNLLFLLRTYTETSSDVFITNTVFILYIDFILTGCQNLHIQKEKIEYRNVI